MTRTEIDLGVLLTQQLTLLTAPQVEAHGLAVAADRLRRRGLVTRRKRVFRPLAPGDGPLAVHRPGDPFPDALARDLANRAAVRAAATPGAEVTVYQATPLAYALWGDAARKKGNPFSFGHDHLLAFVFWKLRPEERARWRYEPSLRPTGPEKFEKVPDAALVDDRGQPLMFHEAVGTYPPARLAALAAHVDLTLGHRAGKPNAGIAFW